MIQINLLPWREKARKIKQIRLAISIASCIGMALVIVIFIHIFYSRLLAHQKQRIDFLQAEITAKQTEFTTLQEDKKKQKDLQEQLHFIMHLRTKSYQAVHLLDELAKTVPATIQLNKITRENGVITIGGIAQSDSEVTVFMKNIAKFPGFKQPILTGISAQETTSALGRNFQLKVEQEQ